MKKGFTIIEIIISIGIIAVIGSISLVSFNFVNNKNKEKKLNNMSGEILTALRAYIETNSEAKDRIYNNQEGMAITLKTLESEGLVDFQDIDVSDGKDYVVAMLSNESDCSDITTVKSWDLTNGPLYICSKSNGAQNLFSVGGDATNLSQATREPYYFKGSYAQNYVQVQGDETKTYRILAIDKDDSLILYSSNSIKSNFEGYLKYTTVSTIKPAGIYAGCINNQIYAKSESNSFNLSKEYEGYVTIYDIENSSICERHSSYGDGYSYALAVSSPFLDSYYYYDSNSQFFYSDNYSQLINLDVKEYYKIQLKNTVKIIGGTGQYADPFIIKLA